MKELIDISQIPSDYGGNGPSLAEAAASGGSSEPGKTIEMVVINELISLTKKQAEKSHTFVLADGKRLMLTVYTKCKTGATATLSRADSGTLVTEIDIVGENENEPYSRKIGGAIEGPGTFTVKLKASAAVPGVFLLLGNYY